MAASDSCAKPVIGLATMLIFAMLGACANNGQLLAPGTPGTIQVYSGDKLTPWPAQFISWDHPANAESMPISKRLWDAGYKIPETHCYLMDESGEPTRLSLLGLWNAAQQGHGVGKISELVPDGALAAARGDFDRIMRIYTEAVWRSSKGSQSQIEAILRDAVNNDATCLRMERNWVQRRVQLLEEYKAPVRDLDGRPGIATINQQDPKRRGQIRQGIQLLEEHDTLVKNVIRSYGYVVQALAPRLAAARPSAPSPPEPLATRPTPEQAPAPAVPSSQGAAVPNKTAAPSRKDRTRPVKVSSRLATKRIVLDTTPLLKESEETQAELHKIRQLCLSRAAIDCSR